MKKLETVKLSRREALKLWDLIPPRNKNREISYATIGRLFDTAFPLGINDPLYRQYVRSLGQDNNQ